MNESYIVTETYQLPSMGLIYDKPISPMVTLRCMSTEEEMRRQPSSGDYHLKTLCDIIQKCIIGDLGMSVYDLHLGDYIYLLHKLRIVTHGSEYKLSSRCPICGNIFKTSFDLDSEVVLKYDEEEYNNAKVITLPQSKAVIELNYQTPKSIDYVNARKKEMEKKAESKEIDFGYMLTLMQAIKTVDGKQLSSAALENFVRHLPARDSNFLLQASAKFNNLIGVEPIITLKCPDCDQTYETPFRITAEFFGPTIYE